MKRYHLRRDDMVMGENEMMEVIEQQSYLMLALCRDGEPYLATVNYAYDAEHRCFYFHCAAEGKKVDFMKANPVVLGQILDDRGYLSEECDYAYRTVQFRGRVTFLSSREEKMSALLMMLSQLEKHPDEVREKVLTESKLETVAVGKIRIEEMSGKKNEK